MKATPIVLTVAVVLNGMMVVGGFVPAIDPAPTAEAHRCSSDDVACVAACVVHRFLEPDHGCLIEPAATAASPVTLSPAPASP